MKLQPGVSWSNAPTRGSQRAAEEWSHFNAASKRWLLQQLLERTGNPPAMYRFRDGVALPSPAATSVATVTFRDPTTILRILLEPDGGFAEGYCRGDIDVEGDLPKFLEAVFRRMPASSLLSRVRSWLRLPQLNTLARSRDNAQHHYDLGNDFYRLWLDEQLVYTCAYFPTPSAFLEEAQVAKMDLVCRKAGLRRGMLVAEAGSGWGALACHMAQHYGVRVKAFNVSHEQVLYSRQRAASLGLHKQVEFIEDDWRNIAGQYDAFISVGMLEHVGERNYERFGDLLRRALKPDGTGFLHFIGRCQPQPLDTWTQQHLFPGAHPPALSEVLPMLEQRDFAVADVENLRLHYAETARHWLTRFEAASDRVNRMFGERFVRMWRLYLAGTAAAFEAGNMQLYQLVFARSGAKHLDWTRAGLYTEEARKQVA